MNNVLHICSYAYGTKVYEDLFCEFAKSNIKSTSVLTVTADYDPRLLHTNYSQQILLEKKWYFSLFRQIGARQLCRTLRHKLRHEEFDIIHSHSLYSNAILGELLAKELKIPHVITVRSTDYAKIEKYDIRQKYCIRNVLRSAKAITFLTKRSEELFLQNDPVFRKTLKNKLHIVPNGIDEVFFQNTGFVGRTGTNILFVGRVVRDKGVLSVVNAVKTLRKITGKSFHLNVVGRPDDGKLLSKIKKQEFVTYSGVVNKKDLVKIYSSSDVLVLPSKNETFGLVYLEALAAGCRVLYSESNPIQSILEKFYPLSMPVEDCEIKIYEKLRDILNCEVKTSSDLTLDLTEFTWRKVAAKYLKVYEND